MKKLAILICGVVLVGLSSCSKECTCTTSYSGPGSEDMPEMKVTVESKADCSEGNSTATVGELTMTVTCK